MTEAAPRAQALSRRSLLRLLPAVPVAAALALTGVPATPTSRPSVVEAGRLAAIAYGAGVISVDQFARELGWTPQDMAAFWKLPNGTLVSEHQVRAAMLSRVAV